MTGNLAPAHTPTLDSYLRDVSFSFLSFLFYHVASVFFLLSPFLSALPPCPLTRTDTLDSADSGVTDTIRSLFLCHDRATGA